jgi:hypothetical protein
MGNPKKLDISFENLMDIALSINENTIANKSKSKNEKIPTDKFIRQFGISRKDFSETIKNTEIKYNPSTFLYDIPKVLSGNNKVTNDDIMLIGSNEQESNYKVTTENKQQSNNKLTKIDQPTKNLTTNLKNIPSELRKVMALSAELEEVVHWYRKHKNDDMIIEVPEININHSDLEGDLTVRSFKTYTKVLDKFADYCKGKKETQKDLIALAIVEFIEKYK